MRRTLEASAPTQEKVFRYAGIDFEITSWRKPLGMLPGTSDLPIEIVSMLAAETYGTNKQQSVIDALSPFQIMSKAMAVRGLEAMMLLKGPRNNDLVYFGSWFGQQAILDYLWWAKTPVSWRPGAIDSLTLVDLDQKALDISERLLSQVSASLVGIAEVETQFKACDALGYYPKWSDAPGIIIWTGLEHFDQNKAARYIRYAQPGTRFLIQATDMPGEDHHTTFHGTYAFANLWADRPVSVSVESCLASTLGWNRWMVGFTVN